MVRTDGGTTGAPRIRAKRSRGGARKGSASGAPVAALLTLAVIVFSAAIGVPGTPQHREGQDPEGPNLDPVTWAAPQRSDTLSRGTALSHVLASRGLDSDQIRAITRQLRPYRDPRTLRPGTALRFSSEQGDAPKRIRLDLNPDSILHFVHSDSAWTTRLELVPFVMDTVRISGLIESSLWSARLGGDLDRLGEGEFGELVYDLADVFAWKIDFTRELRHGDAFRVALERKVRPDGSVRSRHFLAIEFRTRGRVFHAIPQERPGGRYAYFDENGRSLRGAFLRYPVPYRITSHFTGRRYHPLLKRYRAHQGTDYGAPTGTPVEATASGVVKSAGWENGYGRVVELGHPQGIRTRYAHLSAIAPGMRRGAHVEQGQAIGRVGASGLATGAHLHYEFLQNGRHRNPLSVDLPNGPSIGKEHLAEFVRAKDKSLALIDGVPIPYDMRITAADGPPVRRARRK